MFPVTKEVIESKPSPTGKFAAVLEKNKSAGSSKVLYSVFVEQQSFLSNRPLVASFFAGQTDNHDVIVIDWPQKDVLRLRYSHAQRTSSLRNEVQCGDQTIHIQIEEEAKDPSASSK